LNVLCGVSTALDLGHIDLRIVGLDSHHRIGRSRQTILPRQKQQPVRSVYQAIDAGLLLIPFLQNRYARHCIIGRTLEAVQLHLIHCNGNLVTLQ
jgi:hypothetical protein